ncbi:MAG: hypothetical protein DCC67_17905 [Planctomycetota bacterium]|nr:MAG: hypothetical protein DCC67_17905 [Planctomycetota bacterium]
MLGRARKLLTSRVKRLLLPPAAKAEARRDREERLFDDPGPEAAVRFGGRWLARAQDRSKSADGGVARHFSLTTGWAPSYPETTGYIVPTVLALADNHDDADMARRGERMLSWLERIQMPDGAYQGGVVGVAHPVPVVFNTGQILIGLACGASRLGGRFADAMLRHGASWRRPRRRLTTNMPCMRFAT